MLLTCTGHGQSGLKDLDASLVGCYHPKRTKVYNPAVQITTGKCSAEPKLKKKDGKTWVLLRIHLQCSRFHRFTGT